MIKIVFFDWNGTLIADTIICLFADNKVILAFGGTPVDLRIYRETVVIPGIHFYMQHGCDQEELLRESQRVGEILHGHYEPRAAKVRTRKGARRLLQWLQARNTESVILSNHTVHGIQNQLRRLKLEEYFSTVLANDALDASAKGRNKQAKMEMYFKASGLQPHEVMVVGDSPEEVEIGKYVGIKTVAITDGYYARNRLVRSQPDHLINRLDELIGIIEAAG